MKQSGVWLSFLVWLPGILCLLVLTKEATARQQTPESEQRRPVDWVDPHIDTVKPRWFYFASAARPFGLVSLSPDTRTDADWNAGYRYKDTRIECFSHIHEWQLAGIAVMPVSAHTQLSDYSSEFSHEDEVVAPGYHKVELRTHGITAELTATQRVGVHRYSYAQGQPARVVFDLSRQLMECKMSAWDFQQDAQKRELSGAVTLGATHRRPKPVRVYFLAVFQEPYALHGKQEDGRILLDFGPLKRPLVMKLAVSFTSLEGARRNLQAEVPNWDFDRTVTEASAEWNDWLGRISVEGGSPAQKTKLYTDLWHSLLGRRAISDVDGSYPDNTGERTVIRKASLPHHNFDALWGAHWSINTLWGLAWPGVVDEFCTTMVDMYSNGGLIPRGPSGGNYTFVMIGDPAVSFFAAAHAKGIRNWDTQKAYEGLRKNAFLGGLRDHAGYEHRQKATGGGMSYYLERGYVPEDIPGGSGGHRQGAAMTLEYAYQDWCLAQLAKALGKNDDAALFSIRALNYRKVWDPEPKWMRPRKLDGSWYSPFGPVADGFAAKGFVESSSAVYSFYVPHDLQGLADLFGGPQQAAARLEASFRQAEPLRFITDHGRHAVAWVDYENQPSTQLAHLFSHFGQPWRTQYWVRRVHEAAFSDTTPFGGYNGDEDQGQMGALSALMALGLFSTDGGASREPFYELTAPKFDRIAIKLDPSYYPGGIFTIIAHNQGPANVYIQSARLNGRPWNSFMLPHALVIAGGTLELNLGPEPNHAWGLETLPNSNGPP